MKSWERVYGEKDDLQTRIELLTEYVSKAKQNADQLADMHRKYS